MIKQISHLKGRKYTGLGIMSILNEKKSKWGNNGATMEQKAKYKPKMSQLTYFSNYTKTDKVKKPVPFLHRLSNVNFLHFTRGNKLYKIRSSKKYWLTILLTIALCLSGCSGLISYKTEVYIDGKKKAEVISNVPAKAKIGDIEVNQQNETIYEKIGKILPQNIKVEQ